MHATVLYFPFIVDTLSLAYLILAEALLYGGSGCCGQVRIAVVGKCLIFQHRLVIVLEIRT